MSKNDSLIGRCVQLEMVDGAIINVQFLSIEGEAITSDMSVSFNKGGIQKVVLPLDDPFKDIAKGIKQINEITKEAYDFSNKNGVVHARTFLMESGNLHEAFLKAYPPLTCSNKQDSREEKTYVANGKRAQEEIKSQTKEHIELKSVLSKLHEENKSLKAENIRLKEVISKLEKENNKLNVMKKTFEATFQVLENELKEIESKQ